MPRNAFETRWLALPVATLLSCAAGAAEYVKSYAVSGRPEVRVRVGDGAVRVITADTQQVEFRVQYHGYTLDENLSIESRQSGDQVELTARITRPGIGFTNRTMRTEVRMPKTGNLQLQTGDGDVELSALEGTIQITTGDGRVKAERLTGTVDLHTGDGAITVDALKGDVRLRSGDGLINAVNLEGRCTVSSGDGAIRLTGRFERLDIRSGDGPVTARVANGSQMSEEWRLRTGDGAVDLTLPRDFKASLDASTNDGMVHVGLPVTVEGDISTRHVRGTMNGGGPTLSIHTGDGNIRVHAAE